MSDWEAERSWRCVRIRSGSANGRQRRDGRRISGTLSRGRMWQFAKGAITLSPICRWVPSSWQKCAKPGQAPHHVTREA